MKELTLKLDGEFYKDIKEYISSLNGVLEVKVYAEKNEIYIKYDSTVIGISVLKNEVLLYLNSLRIPSICGFDKHSQNKTKKRYMSIDDLCCEYCLKGKMEELLLINGIEKAYADLDIPLNKESFPIYIEYDENIISEKDIIELQKILNYY